MQVLFVRKVARQLLRLCVPRGMISLQKKYTRVIRIGLYCSASFQMSVYVVAIFSNFCPLASAFFTQCPAGSFCPTASSISTPCPGGTYGSVSGLQTALCSGQCKAGMKHDHTDFVNFC